MSFAEVVLRLGCALVGWMLAFVHALVLAVIPSVDCTRVGDPWLASLAVGVPAAAVPLLLGYGARLPELRATLRWLLLPYAGLLVLAVRPVFAALADATLAGGALCPAASQEPLFASASLARAWAPLQLALVLAIGWASWRFFRNEGL